MGLQSGAGMGKYPKVMTFLAVGRPRSVSATVLILCPLSPPFRVRCRPYS